MSDNTMTRADARRAHILATAATVFSERGYRATSIRDLAAEVGMGKPTLYHYFSSKEELLTRLYENVIDEALGSVQEVLSRRLDSLKTLRELIIERIVYTCENKHLLRVFFEEEAELPPALSQTLVRRRRQYEDAFVDVVELRMKEARISLPTSPRIYVYTILGAANWAYKWYGSSGPKDPRQLASEMADLLLAPLAKPGRK